MSNLELKIKHILLRAHCKFEQEKTFNDLKNNGIHMRFDFYLPDINTILEIDGEQHFKPIAHFGGVTAFRHMQENDRRKNSYCLARKIKLYRIPYFKINDLNTYSDLFQSDFLVKTKWHNDKIAKSLKEG